MRILMPSSAKCFDGQCSGKTPPKLQVERIQIHVQTPRTRRQRVDRHGGRGIVQESQERVCEGDLDQAYPERALAQHPVDFARRSGAQRSFACSPLISRISTEGQAFTLLSPEPFDGVNKR